VILTDAGPLVALVDQGEPDHKTCVACLPNLKGPMVTTWPAFTEAMYLLGEAGGWRAQETLWSMLHQGDLEIAFQGSDDYERMRVLMQKYRDRPMDLADASLVRFAEERHVRDIFTLDETDFRTYRIHGRQSFRIWPSKPGS
jgi:predicted nucleic acid-binding protein